MLFGICPTPRPWWQSRKQLHNWVVLVEDLDFDGIFMPDHHMLPFMSNNLLDAWTMLSYFAALTSRIRLGSDVSPVPRWIPSHLAKVIATVDYISGGRVIAGLGVGTVPEEFINYSTGWDEAPVRFEKFKEGLEIILRLWTEDKVTFEGKYYKLKDAVLLPKPLQKPHPPLWCGGLRRRMLEVAARFFDGWVFPRLVPGASLPPEEFEKRVKIIERYAREHNRELKNFTFAVLGSITDTAEIIEAFRNAGCQYYIVELFKGPGLTNPFSPNEYVDVTKRFARDIIPSFK